MGTRLGVYEILAPIGAGGMGEVYRARDTKLGREVAIKVLPDEFSRDQERVARFEREAKLLASLNHPNIATLHGLEHAGGIHFLVMELIEGESLAERLRKGPLPLEQALRYATQIADGLSTAHRRGVVHRDLKPGNIMLTKTGAKLLDFGLAKQTHIHINADSHASTQQRELTGEGVIVGTLQYMAPEQLEGKQTDNRTDIFAFGAVLYEMVTGHKAFEGESQASLISAILTAQPSPIASQQPLAPSMLDRVVQTSLAKDPDERWQNVADMKRQLEWLGGPDVDEIPSTVIGRVGSWRRSMAFFVLGVVAAASLASLFFMNRRSDAPEGRVQRLSLRFPPSQQRPRGSDRALFALSPDGRHLAYLANGQLFLRRIDTEETRPLDGTEGAGNPFFSPDGEWIGFSAQGKIQKVSIRGGAPVTLCDSPRTPFGASWSREGVIVFALSLQGIFQVSEDGGGAEPLVRFEGGENGFRPEVLPGGRALLFTSTPSSNPALRQTVVQSLETGERTVVLANGGDARYAASGHLIYPADRTLMAVPFDPHRVEVTGSPRPVVDITGGPNSQFTFSNDGTLVYEPSEAGARLHWVDRSGDGEPLPVDEATYAYPAFSPDGRSLAVGIDEGDDSNLWVYDIERDALEQLTFSDDAHTPVWTPDGKRIAFCAGRPQNLFSTVLDGSAEPERLTSSEYVQYPTSWSPDGRVLAYNQGGIGDIDIWTLRAEGDSHTPKMFVQTSAVESGARFSPNGRWIAYQSSESGRYEVYVRSFPDGGNKIQISTNGGHRPHWNPAGGELFYRNGVEMMVVDVEYASGFRASRARTLFQTEFSQFTVTPDGERFLIVAPSDTEAALSVVVNWFVELRQLAPPDSAR